MASLEELSKKIVANNKKLDGFEHEKRDARVCNQYAPNFAALKLVNQFFHGHLPHRCSADTTLCVNLAKASVDLHLSCRRGCKVDSLEYRY